MTESRWTPVPGAASRRFSICRNYRGRTHMSDSWLWDDERDSSSLSLDIAECISLLLWKGNSFRESDKQTNSFSRKLFQVYLQQLWTETNFSMQLSALTKRIKYITTAGRRNSCYVNNLKLRLNTNITELYFFYPPVPILWSVSCGAELWRDTSVLLLLLISLIHLRMRD